MPRSVQHLRAAYRRTHWGLDGDRTGPLVTTAADPREGLTELGELVSIVYRTSKLGDGLSDYFHDFEGRLPLLGFNKGGLVIARAGSLYRVTARGIEG